MLSGGNYHYPHALFNNQTKVFEGKEVLIFNPSPTRFEIRFLQIMRTLILKDALRGTVHLQDFIVLKSRKEEGTDAMIKCYQSFHQKYIFIKITKPFLILLIMADPNKPHMEKF